MDAETDRDPRDSGFDLIDAEYIDEEYADPLLCLEERIPAASEDDGPFIHSDKNPDHATDPLLESFVRSAMVLADTLTVRNVSLFSTAIMTLANLVTMIVDGLDKLTQTTDEQERFYSELRALLDELKYCILRIDEYSHENLGRVMTYYVGYILDHLKKSESLFSLVHETLWASAYKLDIVSSKKGNSRQHETRDLENMTSDIQVFRRAIAVRPKKYNVKLDVEPMGADISKKADLIELQARIQLRSGMESIPLDLTHPDREILHQGALFRMLNNKWTETSVILFDHYVVLAETVDTVLRNDDATRESEHVVKYDVSELPIPIDLLLLDSTDNNPLSEGVGGSLLWPFHLRHLGRMQISHTLGTLTHQRRQEWCFKVIEAKQRHAISLQKLNAEPFRLEVLSGTGFVINAVPEAAHTNSSMFGDNKIANIQDTPLHRALLDLEEQDKNTGPEALKPVCRAAVNCATTFVDPYGGDSIVVVGTDYGVYISKYEISRVWTRVSSYSVLIRSIRSYLYIIGYCQSQSNSNRRSCGIFPLPSSLGRIAYSLHTGYNLPIEPFL